MSNKTLNITDKLYDYICTHSLRETQVQKDLRVKTSTLEMAKMQIAPEQGQFMQLLVRLMGARNTLEVGVFTGYSTLAIALALPEDGKILACDVNKEWTDIAQLAWNKAGIRKKIDLRIAPAAQTLKSLLNDGFGGQYDFAFIDADKVNYDTYYEFCLELIRPGGLIAIDNVLWSGDVADEAVNDESTLALRALNNKLLVDGRIDLSLVPIADGLTLALKR